MIALVTVISVAGPSVIHLIYRSGTSLSANQVQTEKYYYLTRILNSDLSISDEQRSDLLDEKKRLFYWFHARGWAIDDGDEGGSLFNRWRELYLYWKG
jgi:hypothetical protein